MINENTDGKVSFYENNDSFTIEAKWKNFFSFQKKMDAFCKEKVKIVSEVALHSFFGKIDKVEELQQKEKKIAEKAQKTIKEEGEQYAESLMILGFADRSYFKMN